MENMKLATLRTADATTAVLVNSNGTLSPLEGFSDVGAWLAASQEARDAALVAAAAAPVLDAPEAKRIAQPVLKPSKVLCIGLNYREHIEETGNQVPDFPTVFPKFAATLTGPYDDVEVPPEDFRIDWEAELAIVIGDGGRRLSVEDAAGAIAGYTAANDISMRGWQGRTAEWTQGKIWEASTPVGPWFVTPEELPADARLTTLVNGKQVQSDSISSVVFSPAELVSYVSTFISLEPGDLILTGTPAGVAMGQKDADGRHPWMKPGDVVEVSVDGLGSQRNLLV